jgi:predicted transposase YdaD
MPKPFDATLKELVEAHPLDWLACLGLSPGGPVTVIDADLSTVTAQADRVLRVDEALPWLLHLELQASRDAALSRRVLKYNVLLFDRHGLPVQSVVMLLRPAADDPALTGVIGYEPPHGRGSTRCEFEVVRLWRLPVEALLAGGIGTLPLAPLADVQRESLPGVIRRMEGRLDRETAPGAAADLWTATYVLMGLRYPGDVTSQLLQGVRAMKESVTYQAILEEGREEGRRQELRTILRLMGAKRFGPANAEVLTALESASGIERLEGLTLRLLDVESWEELLAS